MTRSLYWLALMVTGCFAFSGCAAVSSISSVLDRPAETEADEVLDDDSGALPAVDSVADTVAEEAASAQTDFFREAVNRAGSAVAIGQSAQSPDDWSFAANRWKQAVALMQQVPSTDPNYATAQQKIQEYQANAAQAEQRSAGTVPTGPAQAADSSRPPGLVARIPIVDQRGGTPVVSVTLTGGSGTQRFPMLFDTGATGTLITAEMADAVGVIVTDTATVTVADGRQVELPIGYVDTLQVGELVVKDLWVAIGGSKGLLGQDVYGQYGLSIGRNSIDLYE